MPSVGNSRIHLTENNSHNMFHHFSFFLSSVTSFVHYSFLVMCVALKQGIYITSIYFRKHVFKHKTAVYASTWKLTAVVET